MVQEFFDMVHGVRANYEVSIVTQPDLKNLVFALLAYLMHYWPKMEVFELSKKIDSKDLSRNGLKQSVTY